VNPIIPHFAQYCWREYVYPVIAASSNYDHQVNGNLTKQAWPRITTTFDKIASLKLNFLKDLKGKIRLGYETAK